MFWRKTQFLWKKLEVKYKCFHNIWMVPWGLFLDAIWRICSRTVCIITRLHLRNGHTKKILWVWRFHDDEVLTFVLYYFIFRLFVSDFILYQPMGDSNTIYFMSVSISMPNHMVISLIYAWFIRATNIFSVFKFFVSVFQTKTKRKLLCNLTRNLLLHPK